MLVESGYRIETVPHHRAPRQRGISSNTFLRLADFALSGLAGSAKRLLRVPFLLAIMSLALTGVTLLAALVAWALSGPAGWFAMAALIEANAALVFLFMGFMGDQVRLISERTRGTPLVVERERINFTRD